jgi:hypothetical protein
MINSSKGVSVFANGRVYSVAHDAPHLQLVIDAVEAEDVPALLAALKSAEEKVKAQLTIESTDGFRLTNGVVYFNDQPVNNHLTRTIVTLAEAGKAIAPLKNFFINLRDNPSYRAVQDLYRFLEVGGMPITEDGHFLAYKAVRSNFMDIRSGTFDNSVGAVVQMPRNEVDENPEVTCSSGLHVCSYEYLPNFVHADGHVVVVKINPADVVAIPTDYNNSKMRVCKYEVLQEVEGWYAERRNTLAEYGGADVSGWEVFVSSDDDDDEDDSSDSSDYVDDYYDNDYQSDPWYVVTVAKPFDLDEVLGKYPTFTEARNAALKHLAGDNDALISVTQDGLEVWTVGDC